MDILFRDFSEQQGGGEELLIADLTATEILEMKIVLISAVVAVTDDGMTEMGELCADLVRPSGYEFDFQIGNIFAVGSDS